MKKSWLNSNWTITIIGGLILALIIFIIKGIYLAINDPIFNKINLPFSFRFKFLFSYLPPIFDFEITIKLIWIYLPLLFLFFALLLYNRFLINPKLPKRYKKKYKYNSLEYLCEWVYEKDKWELKDCYPLCNNCHRKLLCKVRSVKCLKCNKSSSIPKDYKDEVKHFILEEIRIEGLIE